jgi:TPP-dependent 2-oxoacid decarboxylase
MTFKRILVAGFGTHFKDRYFEVLKPMFLNKSAEIAAIIDLECKKNEINDFISKNYTLPKPTMIFLPEEMRNNLTTIDIDKEVGYITHVLVCT